ncbi:MAG: 4'-phosphopantetheinyl transferase [Pararhodobacter sp.]
MRPGASPGTEATPELRAALRGLFPDGVELELAGLAEGKQAPLFDVEQSAIANAMPARRLEFTAGRLAAHLAMRSLGLSAQAIAMAPDRAPIWPAGLKGSISHGAEICAAVISADPAIRSLGLDIEPDSALPVDILDTVLMSEERAWLSAQAHAGHLARVIFCIKEAVYKAQYPLSRLILGFDALRIMPDPEAGTFQAEFLRDCHPFRSGDRLAGRFIRSGGIIAAGVCIF